MAEGVAVLERTPPTLNALLRGLPDGFVFAHEGGETWSPFDVLGHLIHGEETDWVQGARSRACSTSSRRCARPTCAL